VQRRTHTLSTFSTGGVFCTQKCALTVKIKPTGPCLEPLINNNINGWTKSFAVLLAAKAFQYLFPGASRFQKLILPNKKCLERLNSVGWCLFIWSKRRFEKKTNIKKQLSCGRAAPFNIMTHTYTHSTDYNASWMERRRREISLERLPAEFLASIYQREPHGRIINSHSILH
jgi:hypothetical protein